ncbi:MAG: hypothetical protein FWF88_07785 [Peptococcaceae bacterium]|nr:hypothetical protein [Peptococcaceae bacterium]
MTTLLFGPLGVILISANAFFLAAFAVAAIISRRSRGPKRAALKTALCLSCLAWFLLVCITSTRALMYDFSSPSQVSLAPLEQMAEYPAYSLEDLKDRIEGLQNIEDVKRLYGHQWAGDVGRVWVYHYDMSDRDIPASIGVYFWIFDNPTNAMNSFNRSHPEKQKRVVTVSETIDVMLCHAVMYRNVDTFYSYDSQRSLYTCIRLGNMVISISEHLSEPRNIGALTDKNLELICQALTSQIP